MSVGSEERIVTRGNIWQFIEAELDQGHLILMGPESMTESEIRGKAAAKLFFGKTFPDIQIVVAVRGKK